MSKKKIALIVDSDSWAYANIARNISTRLSEYYDFDIIPSIYFNDELAKIILLTKDYDLLHFFWRGKVLEFDSWGYRDYLKRLGLSPKKITKECYEKRIITTSVYDHLYLDDEITYTREIAKKCDRYYVSSNKLFDIYNSLELAKKPTCVITDGVDLNRFYPKNVDRFKNIKDRKIVIGWVGNSAWANDKEDFKGVNTILKPAIKELIEEGYNIEPFFADREERMIPHDEMIDYYSKIDLYICTSKCEGTPNPVLESMACGVPIISTDVGIVPDALGELQKKYILEERSIECLKEKIKLFINDLDNVEKLREESLNRIQDWTWDKISLKMKKFFDDAFEEIKK